MKSPNNTYHIFWGGADIHPSFYNRKPSKQLGQTNMHQDEEDIALAKSLIKNNIPCIGICRGGQLLNVVNGGTLVQHLVDHPNGKHTLVTFDNKEIECNSSHHQMMLPQGNYQLLAWHDNKTACLDPVTDQPTMIPQVNEVIWYPDTQCLCIQPHPEWLHHAHEFVQWINSITKSLLDLTIDWKAEHYGQEY